jgi:hypothetical protein
MEKESCAFFVSFRFARKQENLKRLPAGELSRVALLSTIAKRTVLRSKRNIKKGAEQLRWSSAER